MTKSLQGQSVHNGYEDESVSEQANQCHLPHVHVYSALITSPLLKSTILSLLCLLW